MLEIGERGSVRDKAGVVHIPRSELSIRARYELERSVLTIVDCGKVADTHCRSALKYLGDQGFVVGVLAPSGDEAASGAPDQKSR
jgi:hypothetical protein